MAQHITKVVESPPGTYRAKCKGCPEWTGPARCTSSGAAMDCKQHKAQFPSTCTAIDCPREARMAIRTFRPAAGTLQRLGRDRIYTVIDYDDRVSPASAPMYCRQCGLEIAMGLIQTLVNEDGEPHATVREQEELAGTGEASHG